MTRSSDTGTARAVPRSVASGDVEPRNTDATQLIQAAEPANSETERMPAIPTSTVRPSDARENRITAADDTTVIPSVARPEFPTAGSGASTAASGASTAATGATSATGATAATGATGATAATGAPGATGVPTAQPHRGRTLGMWVSVVIYWLLAIPIGVLSAVLVAGRHATLCSKSSTGLGCTSTGSSIGIVLLVVLVAVVGTVSVYAYDARQSVRRWGAAFGIGIAVLVAVGAVAWLLVRTIQ